MKSLATIVCLILGLTVVAGVAAQTAPAPTTPPGGSTPSREPASPPGQRSDPAPQTGATDNSSRVTPPGAQRSTPDVNVDVKSERRDDRSGSASPRTSPGESTRILGMSPTMAVLLAAALLVIVILALVAMSRSGSDGSTHIDVDRRL